jgi:hypothetical protein
LKDIINYRYERIWKEKVMFSTSKAPENHEHLAPVALFVHKRLDETRQTVKALQKNTLAKESKLFIFSDGPANDQDKESITEIRDYIHNISGFKEIEIKESDSNLGLAESIISGVTEILERFNKIIVVEDDLCTSPFFLKYMNDALNCYQEKTEVASISGYSVPLKNNDVDLYFLPGTFWWGWATWKDRWELFNEDGAYLFKELKKRHMMKEYNINGSFIISPEIILKKHIKAKLSSWAVRWHASMVLAGKLSLYPSRSFVNNIGIGSGVNCRVKSNCLNTQLADEALNVDLLPARVRPEIVKKIKKFYLKAHLRLLYNLIKKLIIGKY